MKILVTGADGFIGSHLIETINNTHEVYATTRKRPTQVIDGIHWVHCDLSTPLDLDALPTDLNAIFHLAQSRQYRAFPEGAQDMIAVNMASTVALLDYARQAGVSHVFYASSGGVYSPATSLLQEEDTVEIEKLNFYQQSKYMAELIIQQYASFFDVCCICRLFFVYGPRQSTQMLIPRLVRNVMDGNAIHLDGDQGIRINPIYISDAIAALQSLIDMDGNHTINIAGPEVITLRAIGETIGEVLGKSPFFDLHSDAPPRAFVADTSRMHERLSVPSVKFREGIERYIASL